MGKKSKFTASKPHSKPDTKPNKPQKRPASQNSNQFEAKRRKPAAVHHNKKFNVDRDDERLRQYGQWAQGHGFELSEKVKLASKTVHHRGMVAVQFIKAGEPLFKIDRHMLLSAETCTLAPEIAEFIAYIKEHQGSESDSEEEENEAGSEEKHEAGEEEKEEDDEEGEEGDKEGEEGDEDDEEGEDGDEEGEEGEETQELELGWTPLILGLMYEYHIKASKWRPYFNVLPDLKSLTHPHFWTENERGELLQGLPLSAIIEEDLEHMQQHYQAFVLEFMRRSNKLRPDVHTFEMYCQLAALVMSYSFTDDITGQVIMVPMADLLNHRTGSNNARLFYNENFLQMQAICDIDSTDEVFNTYGKLGNTEMLRKYGFVEDFNKDFEVIEISLIELFPYLPTNVNKPEQLFHKLDLLASLQLCTDNHRVHLAYLRPQGNPRFDPTIPNIPLVVFNALRVLVLTTQQLQSYERLFKEDGILSVSSENSDDGLDDDSDDNDGSSSDEDEEGDDDDNNDEEEEEAAEGDLDDFSVPCPDLVEPGTVLVDSWYHILPSVDALARDVLSNFLKERIATTKSTFEALAQKYSTTAGTPKALLFKANQAQVIRQHHIDIMQDIVASL